MRRINEHVNGAIRPAAYIAVAVLVLCGSALGSEWSSVRTSNFLIVGEVTELEVRSAAVRLEQFRDTFSTLFPKLKVDNRTPTTVIIFRDSDSYRNFRPRRPDGSPDEGIAGYFLAGEAVNYITLAMRGGKSDPYHTIFHEYMHFLLRTNAGKGEMPAWLGEGVAQYYETMRVTADNTAIIGDPPQGRMGTLRRGRFLPWNEFFAAKRSAVHDTADAPRSMFYAQAWLLVHYLMHKGPDAGPDRLERFIELLEKGGSSESALQAIFQTDAAELNTTLQSYLGTPQLPTTVAKLTGRETLVEERLVEKVPGPLASALLGDLLLHMERRGEAEKLLRTAIAGDKGLAFAHASLGHLLIRSNRGLEAVKHLEAAIAKGPPTFLDHFNYAYALSHTVGSGGMVSSFPEATAGKMRASLRRAIELQPEFAESYRLLAFMHFVNGSDTDEAASLLEKALDLKPGNEHFEVLYSRILLKQERFDEAKRLAEKLSRGAKAPQVREEAAEVLASAVQFSKARLQVSIGSTSGALPWSPSLILLKRSWVDESDLSVIEKNRYIANLNRLLERSRSGEERILGTLERIECVRGGIIYTVRSGDALLRFGGERFTDLRLAVLVNGSKTFAIDCGVSLPKAPAVLMYAPQQRGLPRLTSVTFVPDDFELWSTERLSAARQVIVEDDLLRRNADVPDGLIREKISTEERWRSIARNLRTVRKGERRLLGSLDSIECSESGFTVVASINGEQIKLRTEQDVVPAWFTAGSSQVLLACGADPQTANVLFTIRGGDATTDRDPVLSAMEFVPEGFRLDAVSGPGR